MKNLRKLIFGLCAAACALNDINGSNGQLQDTFVMRHGHTAPILGSENTRWLQGQTESTPLPRLVFESVAPAGLDETRTDMAAVVLLVQSAMGRAIRDYRHRIGEWLTLEEKIEVENAAQAAAQDAYEENGGEDICLTLALGYNTKIDKNFKDISLPYNKIMSDPMAVRRLTRPMEYVGIFCLIGGGPKMLRKKDVHAAWQLERPLALARCLTSELFGRAAVIVFSDPLKETRLVVPSLIARHQKEIDEAEEQDEEVKKDGEKTTGAEALTEEEREKLVRYARRNILPICAVADKNEQSCRQFFTDPHFVLVQKATSADEEKRYKSTGRSIPTAKAFFAVEIDFRSDILPDDANIKGAEAMKTLLTASKTLEEQKQALIDFYNAAQKREVKGKVEEVE